MHKLLVLPSLVAGLLLSSCSVIQVSSMSREEESSSSIAPTSREKEKLISDLKENEYNLVPGNFVEKMNSFTTYKAVTEGETKASVLFITVPQKINVTVIKNEYSYLYNSSESSMYSSEHHAYYHDNKAVYKDKNDNDYNTSVLADYLNKYGTYPFNSSIEGYKIGGDAINEVTKLDMEGEYYRFKIAFDKEKATTNVRIQMKEFGALIDYPDFLSDIQVTLTLKNDYTPVKLELESRYKAAQSMGTASCHQQYTVTYSSFNESIEVPNLDTIKPYFDK